MFDFIPVEYYSNLQYIIIFGVVLTVLFYAFSAKLNNTHTINLFSTLGIIFAVFFTFYMGQRQISSKFGDTVNYNRAYDILLSGKEFIITNDFLFNYMMVLSSKVMSVRGFFQLVSFLYIVPVIMFSRKYFRNYWFFSFIMFVGSMSFWAYGVNGLRNGVGTSLFVLGLYYYHKKWAMYICFGLSYFMHASLIIPIAAFISSGLYKDPKFYLYVWLCSIPLSLLGGSFWSNFFSNLGLVEDRTSGYLTGGSEYNDSFSHTGFRFDFLLYSSTAILAGWYFIFKKKITDPFYIRLFGIYCISNAFWILVITAAFSNRFAYLSWFLMPAVISYPMFRYKIWDNQDQKFAIILFLNFVFTFLMNVILV